MVFNHLEYELRADSSNLKQLSEIIVFLIYRSSAVAPSNPFPLRLWPEATEVSVACAATFPSSRSLLPPQLRTEVILCRVSLWPLTRQGHGLGGCGWGEKDSAMGQGADRRTLGSLSSLGIN